MKVEGHPCLQLKITISLNEQEARALAALKAYGFDAFKKAYRENLGRSVWDNNEFGMKSLFDTLGDLHPYLMQADAARRLLAESVRKGETPRIPATPASPGDRVR